ncbi:MAG: carboxypeptidase-like regulatory domain-containing protein [Acidobacteriota bacterium]
MKKFFFVCALAFCSTLLTAQERFFLYGKILGADGTPVPSAQVSLSTVLGRQPLASAQAGADGSFRLIVSQPDLAMLTFAAPLHDSLSIPLLLTTVQRTMSVTIKLAGGSLSDSSAGAMKAPGVSSLHMRDENTELGIAERLMIALIEEKRLDAQGMIFTPGRGAQRRDPDSLLAVLSSRIQKEDNPMHRELFLFRYLQVCTNARRTGSPAVLAMAAKYIEADSPFWTLVPELLAAFPASSGAGAYRQMVRTRTSDGELKTWIDTQH